MENPELPIEGVMVSEARPSQYDAGMPTLGDSIGNFMEYSAVDGNALNNVSLSDNSACM
jgi:hypothetical protein